MKLLKESFKTDEVVGMGRPGRESSKDDWCLLWATGRKMADVERLWGGGGASGLCVKMRSCARNLYFPGSVPIILGGSLALFTQVG